VSINCGGKAIDVRIHVDREVISRDLAYFELIAEHVVPTQTQVLSKAKRFVGTSDQQDGMVVRFGPIVICCLVKDLERTLSNDTSAGPHDAPERPCRARDDSDDIVRGLSALHLAQKNV